MPKTKTLLYGSLFMEQGERWSKVQEQIDGLAGIAPSGSPLYFDIFCAFPDMEEALAISNRTREYATAKGLTMDERPTITVRLTDGSKRVVVIGDTPGEAPS